MDAETRYRLLDMLEYASRATRFIEGRSADEIERDEVYSLALVRAVQIVGEAARKVSQPTRLEAPDLPWRNAVAMRNILVHGYRYVDFGIVIDTVRHDFPGLIAVVQRLLDAEDDTE